MGTVTAETLVADVFRRADKSRSGWMNFEDFCDFFAEKDGCLGLRELWEVFHLMDVTASGRIAATELASFCTDKVIMGSLEPAFGALRDLAGALPPVFAIAHDSTGEVELPLAPAHSFGQRLLLSELIAQLETMTAQLSKGLASLKRAAGFVNGAGETVGVSDCPRRWMPFFVREDDLRNELMLRGLDVTSASQVVEKSVSKFQKAVGRELERKEQERLAALATEEELQRRLEEERQLSERARLAAEEEQQQKRRLEQQEQQRLAEREAAERHSSQRRRPAASPTRSGPDNSTSTAFSGPSAHAVRRRGENPMGAEGCLSKRQPQRSVSPISRRTMAVSRRTGQRDERAESPPLGDRRPLASPGRSPKTSPTSSPTPSPLREPRERAASPILTQDCSGRSVARPPRRDTNSTQLRTSNLLQATNSQREAPTPTAIGHSAGNYARISELPGAPGVRRSLGGSSSAGAASAPAGATMALGGGGPPQGGRRGDRSLSPTPAEELSTRTLEKIRGGGGGAEELSTRVLERIRGAGFATEYPESEDGGGTGRRSYSPSPPVALAAAQAVTVAQAAVAAAAAARQGALSAARCAMIRAPDCDDAWPDHHSGVEEAALLALGTWGLRPLGHQNPTQSCPAAGAPNAAFSGDGVFEAGSTIVSPAPASTSVAAAAPSPTLLASPGPITRDRLPLRSRAAPGLRVKQATGDPYRTQAEGRQGLSGQRSFSGY